MSTAYTPGLEVSPQTVVRRLRELPLSGRALVKAGVKVEADDQVLAAELPGELIILRVADQLRVDVEEALRGLKINVGDTISTGQLLCQVTSLFGLSKRSFLSPTAGTVEFITESNAHVAVRQAPLPLEIDAYISGQVVEVVEGRSVTIESDVALVQGIFGVGGERRGTLTPIPVSDTAVVTPADLKNLRLSGSIIVGGCYFSKEALATCAESGVQGVITGSIDSETLQRYVGYDIGVSITGDEQVPFTLIVTEGFGRIPLASRISNLCRELSGKQSSINGATQVRAGAMRPELVVPLKDARTGTTSGPLVTSSGLQVGSTIRVIRVPYFGQLATVTALPTQPCRIATGAEVRVLEAKLSNGERVVVPRANVELV